MWASQGNTREQILRGRYAREQLEFNQVNKTIKNQDELVPRQSGSLEWRQDRGEMGTTELPADLNVPPSVV